MPVPQIQGIHAVFHQHIQIFYPLFLIIKPREALRRIGILIHPSSGQVFHFLNPYTTSAKHHFRSIRQLCRKLQILVLPYMIYQFPTAVNHTASVVSCHRSHVSTGRNGKPLLFQSGSISSLFQTDAYLIFIHTGSIRQHNRRIPRIFQRFLQMFSCKQHPVRRLLRHHNIHIGFLAPP